MREREGATFRKGGPLAHSLVFNGIKDFKTGSHGPWPNPALRYLPKEAVLSSQIEGTQSSLQDLLAAEAVMFDAPGMPKDVAAMNHGHSMLTELRVSTVGCLFYLLRER